MCEYPTRVLKTLHVSAEPELAPPPTSVPLAAVPPPQGQPVEEAPYADAEDGADDYFDEGTS